MSSVRFVLPLFALIGCGPQNASMNSGQFAAFLAASTSPSLSTRAVDINDEEWDFGYNVDCRDDFENPADREARQLQDPIRVCGEAIWPPVHELWAERDGYSVVGGEFIDYRGEALINSEGDLQFAFHHRLPNGEDFRIVFSVDPDFQPTECVEGENEGEVLREPLDGDWVANWSRELEPIANGNIPRGFEYLEEIADGGRLYFINSNAYQIDPDFANNGTTDERWIFPNQWRSGASVGKFSQDLFEERETRYGEPALYELEETTAPGIDLDDLGVSNASLWLCAESPVRPGGFLSEGEDPTTNACMLEITDRMNVVADETEVELRRLFTPGRGVEDNPEPVFEFRPMVHINDWREPDGRAPGIDGWGQMEYSFVVFSEDSVLEAGGDARGAFQLLLEGTGSTSRFFVKGTFEAKNIKNDRWGAGDLFAEKAEENGVTLCFEQ